MFCGWKNVMKLEKLQEQAVRFIFKDNNSSYMDFSKWGKFLLLSAYRIRNLAMVIFKWFTAWILCIWLTYFVNKKRKYDLWDITLPEQTKFSTKTYSSDIMDQVF